MPLQSAWTRPVSCRPARFALSAWDKGPPPSTHEAPVSKLRLSPAFGASNFLESDFLLPCFFAVFLLACCPVDATYVAQPPSDRASFTELPRLYLQCADHELAEVVLCSTPNLLKAALIHFIIVLSLDSRPCYDTWLLA